MNELKEIQGNLEKTISDADEYKKIISNFLAKNQHYKALIKMQEISVKQWNDEMTQISTKIPEINDYRPNYKPYRIIKADYSHESILTHVGIIQNNSLAELEPEFINPINTEVFNIPGYEILESNKITPKEKQPIFIPSKNEDPKKENSYPKNIPKYNSEINNNFDPKLKEDNSLSKFIKDKLMDKSSNENPNSTSPTFPNLNNPNLYPKRAPDSSEIDDQNTFVSNDKLPSEIPNERGKEPPSQKYNPNSSFNPNSELDKIPQSTKEPLRDIEKPQIIKDPTSLFKNSKGNPQEEKKDENFLEIIYMFSQDRLVLINVSEEKASYIQNPVYD